MNNNGYLNILNSTIGDMLDIFADYERIFIIQESHTFSVLSTVFIRMNNIIANVTVRFISSWAIIYS